MHLGIMAQRLKMAIAADRLCDGFAVHDAAGAKGNGEPKPLRHLGGQDLQLNFAHELDV